MYLKVRNKKIEILEYTNVIDQIKSLKFVLEPIDYGIKLPNKRMINTYFFCQRVDICITNSEEKIIKLFENIKSEKRKFLWKKYHIYYLPLNTAKDLTVGDTLKLEQKNS